MVALTNIIGLQSLDARAETDNASAN